MSKLLSLEMKTIRQDGQERAESPANGQEYWKFRGVNSPDEPRHKVLPWRQDVAFGGALKLSIIDFDG